METSKNIPEIFKNSTLYRSFAKENKEITEDILDFSKKFIKKINFNDVNDFLSFLEVCKVWDIDYLPKKLYFYLYNNICDERMMAKIVVQYPEVFPLVRFMIDTDATLSFESESSINIVFYDHVFNEHFIDFLCEIKHKNNICNFCAKRNNVELLKYAIRLKCPIDREVFKCALSDDNIDVLKYLHESVIEISKTEVLLAVIHNAEKCLRFLLDNNFFDDDEKWIFHAAQYSNILIFEVYYNKGFKVDYSIAEKMAVIVFTKMIEEGFIIVRDKHLPIELGRLVRFLKHLEKTNSNFKISTYAFTYIIQFGIPFWLQFMKNSDLPFDIDTLKTALRSNKIDNAKFLIENGCKVADDVFQMIEDNEDQHKFLLECVEKYASSQSSETKDDISHPQEADKPAIFSQISNVEEKLPGVSNI